MIFSRFSLAEVVIFLFLSTVISHGMILLDNGVYWDGWIIRGWFRQKDYRSFRTATSQIGLPIYYYFQRFMAMLPHPVFCYKLLAFLCMFLSSLFIYCLCRETGYFTDIQSLCISLLFLCYPANHMMVEPSCMQYGLMHTIFLGACLLGILAESGVGAGQWIMRCSAIVFFLISFNMNSLLVYFTGFALLLLLRSLGNEESTLADAVRYVLWRWYYLVLPFIYWSWKQEYARSHGYYSDYNLIKFNLWRIFNGTMQLLKTGVVGVYVDALLFIAKRPLKWIIAVTAVSAVLIYALSSNEILLRQLVFQQRSPFLVTFYGCILLICASIPYMLVGQRFGSRGFETKNNIIIALPMALIIFDGVRSIAPAAVPHLLIILFIVGVIYLNYNYLCLLSVYAKNLSLLTNLGRNPSAKGTGIFLIHDCHSVRFLAIDQPEHRSPYLIYMFEWLWGDVTRFGINESYARLSPYTPEEIETAVRDATTIPYALQGIDPHGKQALVLVNDGKKSCVGEVTTAVQYLLHRFFKRDRLDEFLSDVTHIDLIPLQTAEK